MSYALHEQVTLLACELRVANGELRLGQSLFNALHELYPHIAETVRGRPLDPFYLDERIGPFLRWLGDVGINEKKESTRRRQAHDH